MIAKGISTSGRGRGGPGKAREGAGRGRGVKGGKQARVVDNGGIADIEDRINDLLPRMTLEEKVAQMCVYFSVIT